MITETDLSMNSQRMVEHWQIHETVMLERSTTQKSGSIQLLSTTTVQKRKKISPQYHFTHTDPKRSRNAQPNPHTATKTATHAKRYFPGSYSIYKQKTQPEPYIPRRASKNEHFHLL